MRHIILLTLAISALLLAGSASAQELTITQRTGEYVANYLDGIQTICTEDINQIAVRAEKDPPYCFLLEGSRESYIRNRLEHVINMHDDLAWIRPWQILSNESIVRGFLMGTTGPMEAFHLTFHQWDVGVWRVILIHLGRYGD
jgi:hypothetical protein